MLVLEPCPASHMRTANTSCLGIDGGLAGSVRSPGTFSQRFSLQALAAGQTGLHETKPALCEPSSRHMLLES